MPDYQGTLDWLAGQQEKMTALLWAWSGINSGTHNPLGLAEQGELIAQEFASLADQLSWRDPSPVRNLNHRGESVPVHLGRNLVVTKRSQAPLRVLLAIHMDTVYGPESSFQSVEQTDANTLRGPAVADAKGGLVILLFALKALERHVAATGAKRLGWDVIINSDEEIGSPGSRALFEEIAKSVQLGLLFEPSLPSGQLVSNRKGTGNFSVSVEGRAAHSGRDFAAGRNAVVAAAEVATRLHALTGRWLETTFNIARIEGGSPNNVVPERAVLRLNIRYRHHEDEESIREAMNDILTQVAEQMDVAMQLHGDFFSPPKALTPEVESMLTAFRDCGDHLGLSLSWAPSGGACDGNRLAAFGIPNVDTLGVRGGNIHSDLEFALLDSLPERAQLTALFLMRLADGDLSLPFLASPPSSG